MASDNETLEEEKKQEDIANAEEDTAELKVENEAKNNDNEDEEEEKAEGDLEMVHKEEEVSEDKEKPEGNSEKESKEEVKTRKKSKRVRQETPEKSESKKSASKGSKKAKGESNSKEPPVTPIERPTRERKTVERYTETTAGRGSASKQLSIEKVLLNLSNNLQQYIINCSYLRLCVNAG